MDRRIMSQDDLDFPFAPDKYRDWRVAQERRESRQNKRKGKK